MLRRRLTTAQRAIYERKADSPTRVLRQRRLPIRESEPAVQSQNRAGDVARVVRAEERDGLTVFLDRPQPPQRDLGGDLEHDRGARELALAFGVDPAGLQHVDVDP